MGIFYFPCNFVYWRKVSNHEKYKKRILEIIENNKDEFISHGLVSNGISTYNVRSGINEKIVHGNPDIIQDVVWDTLDELINFLNSRENTIKTPIKNSCLESAWISIYNENSTVSMHNHYVTEIRKKNDIEYRPSFVVVYIINDPNEKNTTSFMQPYTMSNSLHSMTDLHFHTSDKDEIGEGSVLIFPATLHHEVKKMELPGRIIVSFNIWSNIKD